MLTRNASRVEVEGSSRTDSRGANQTRCVFELATKGLGLLFFRKGTWYSISTVLFFLAIRAVILTSGLFQCRRLETWDFLWKWRASE